MKFVRFSGLKYSPFSIIVYVHYYNRRLSEIAKLQTKGGSRSCSWGGHPLLPLPSLPLPSLFFLFPSLPSTFPPLPSPSLKVGPLKSS